MFKLTVVAGPNRGSTFPASNGDLFMGRQNGNAIVLPSAKVSKKHCVLEVRENELTLKDLGSSNGTFLNGVLVTSKKVVAGDRIGVGEYVLEISESVQRSSVSAPGVPGFEDLIQFPAFDKKPLSQPHPTDMGMGSQLGGFSNPNLPPKDFKGKAIWYFENQFMPIFYDLNSKYEWRLICAGMIGVFIVANLIISVYPLIDASRATVIRETRRRALFMAKQIVERNTAYLAAKAETRTEIGSVESADGVRLAVLIDLDNRILAPGIKMNQYLINGTEARLAVEARDLFRAGRETGFSKETPDSTVVAIEPVKILNAALGKNVVVAMAVVSVDTSLYTADLGEMGITYSQTLIFTGALAAIILLILHRLTLRPFLKLNEDMDKALKGDLPQVSHDYKVSELDSLWEIINAAIQRIPKAQSAGGGDLFGGEGGPSIDEYIGPLRTIGNIINIGILVLDHEKKIVHMNSLFEEVSGIRLDNALGFDVSEVARDQAMGAFTSDILSRVPVGGDGVSEDFEISGMPYKVHVCAFGQTGGVPRCFILLTARPDE